VGRFVIAARLRTTFYSVRVLATIACHSAVKLGDKLSDREMEAADKRLLSSRYPATCPQGRSIFYRLDHKDIARKLDRH
jgi:DNA mismatch repair protein MutL